MAAVVLVSFLAVLSAIVVALHAYVGWRTIGSLGLGPSGTVAVAGVFVVSCVVILLTLFVGRSMPPGGASRVFLFVGFTLMGTIAILFALHVARDVLLLLARSAAALARAGGSPEGPIAGTLTRRDVLAGVSNWAVLGAGGVLAAGSVVQAVRDPVVEEVAITLPRLPTDLEGFTIAQISDLHLGPTLGRAFAARVVERVNGLCADLVVVTGDLADGHVADLADVVRPLADLEAPRGVAYVTGNHEYYWGAPAWIEHVRSWGWDVLQNEHRILRVGTANLALGGVTDLSARAPRSDPAAAIKGAEEADVRLLLAHQPRSLYRAREAGWDVQLSGHTHGGQVFPMTLLVYLVHPIVKGLGRFGDMWVYVNRGTGTWGPPMRTGRRGEITRIRLIRA